MSYRAVLSVPGAAAFSAAGLALRLPQAVYPVGLVLLASLGTGDYAVGGSLTAAFILGGAVGNPVLSRVADRRGQRSVLLPAAAVHVATLAALVLVVGGHAALWIQVMAAAAVGVSYVPAGALVRARWVHLLADSADRLGPALSIESTFDEVLFVVGPVVATVLATMVHPAAPFVLTAVFVAAASLALHRMRATTPVLRRTSGLPGRPSSLPVAAAVTAVLVAVAVGVTLVAVDLSAIAYVGQAGQAAWTGAALGCFALGSGVAGLAYGARRWRRPVENRLVPAASVFAVLPLLLPLASSVPTLAALMLAVGIGTAPLLITLFGVLERVAPAERSTEALAWVTTGINIGAGLAAPLVGVVAAHHGARTALFLPAAAALTAGLLAVAAANQARAHLTGHRSKAVSRHPNPAART